MDVILGDNELIEAAMQKSPQRIRNFAINQADTIRPAKNNNNGVVRQSHTHLKVL